MSKGSTFHIPSLDGLRAVSFLIVFVAHAGLDDVVPGGFGVTVFFFLSGFLITTLMRIERDKRGEVDLKAFYLRRVLRILPPFYLVLLVATALAAAGVVPIRPDGPLDPRPLLAQFGHVSNYWFASRGYHGIVGGTAVYWSLAVEEHFYLLFPWLYLLLQRVRLTDRRQGALLWALCAAICAWRCALVFVWHAPADRTYLASDTRFDSVLFGCALAVSANPILDRPRVSEALWKYLLVPLGIATLLLTFAYRAQWFRESIRYTLQGIALTPIFVTAMRFPRWAPYRLLNDRRLAFIGVLSYSLYLVHHVALNAVQEQLPRSSRPWQGTVALAISLVAAYAMYRLVERPCARLRARMAKGTERVAPRSGLAGPEPA